MKLLVITDAHLVIQNGQKVAYAPYVKEMDLWMNHVSHITFLCPDKISTPLLAQAFKRQDFKQIGLRRLEFHRFSSVVLSLLSLPFQTFQLCNAMRKADHIHLRCPGNLALLASMIQIFFPRKQKTVKYAGNWDPQSTQPFAYKWQKAILSNPRLSKNIQILVYGAWPDQSKNVLPFFTASYHRTQIQSPYERLWDGPIYAVFVGTLSPNKRPLELLEIAAELIKKGIDFHLHFYGNGKLYTALEQRVTALGLENRVRLHGNVGQDELIKAYQKAHFSFLLSKSEGWPKAVAEAMFWGCIPVATPVSCVPWMLDFDKESKKASRGMLISNLDQAAPIIKSMLDQPEVLEKMSQNAAEWSQQYTMEDFEEAIVKVLQQPKDSAL
ncbi:glycosyltransferase family 4 protein [Nonlabens xiamenensis]|uniref:glycosyltransferase family 4 protein n=1 Tax=Nonlabens xiamenensis TaxID=2341043 RepID=UPI001F0C3CA3|nr:glycosyltransferase [Nonlabens xiamenensis]